jgi:hypothetical protein
MVQTHGLTHINLAVRDLGRADPDGYEIEIWFE